MGLDLKITLGDFCGQEHGSQLTALAFSIQCMRSGLLSASVLLSMPVAVAFQSIAVLNEFLKWPGFQEGSPRECVWILVKIMLADTSHLRKMHLTDLHLFGCGWSLPGLWVVNTNLQEGKWNFEINLCPKQPEALSITFSVGEGSGLMGNNPELGVRRQGIGSTTQRVWPWPSHFICHFPLKWNR